MPDRLTVDERSAHMARIRSRGNKATEAVFIRLLRASKVHGWRRHFQVMGRPDFAFPADRVAVFIDGCFWHACSNCYRLPATNVPYWAAKARRNRKRDRIVTRALRTDGWVVLRIWEHDVGDRVRTLRRLRRALSRGRRSQTNVGLLGRPTSSGGLALPPKPSPGGQARHRIPESLIGI
jgi:DNA mismatch endonuclease, patch repair protein